MNDWPQIPHMPLPPNTDSPSAQDNQKILDGQKSEAPFFSETAPAQLPVVTPSERDINGRFLAGNSGSGGRKKGARNKLTELFLKTIVEDFAVHGASALERVRKEDPAFYLKMIAVLVPKSLIEKYEVAPNIDYENLSHEEIVQIIEETRRRKFVENAIKNLSDV